MSVQRLTLLACAMTLLATCNATSSKSEPHNLRVGSRVWGDQMIDRVIVDKSASWLFTVEEERTFSGDGVSTITMVNLLDQARDGNGATAVIVHGGPGFNFVTIKFKSQRRQPISFVVEIYGKR